jgi:hypothetical protein
MALDVALMPMRSAFGATVVPPGKLLTWASWNGTGYLFRR